MSKHNMPRSPLTDAEIEELRTLLLKAQEKQREQKHMTLSQRFAAWLKPKSP